VGKRLYAPAFGGKARESGAGEVFDRGMQRGSKRARRFRLETRRLCQKIRAKSRENSAGVAHGGIRGGIKIIHIIYLK
jgi:hypothetical protein